MLSLRPRTSGLLAQLIQADTKEPKKDLDEEMKSCDNNMRKFNHSYIREASELKDVTKSGKVHHFLDISDLIGKKSKLGKF